MNKDTHEMLSRLERAGIASEDALALRRIAMTLHRWHELECGDGNGYIERDEETGKPIYYNDRARYFGANDIRRGYSIPDREKGALKRLDAIMARYHGFRAYVQTDPRGASLYILSPHVLSFIAGRDIEANYSQGIAVYK